MKRTIATGLAHVTNDFLPRSNPGDMVRAGGSCVCSHCGHEYNKHPSDPYELDSNGTPFLTVLCDSRRVKL